jgi:hypothetical protein
MEEDSKLINDKVIAKHFYNTFQRYVSQALHPGIPRALPHDQSSEHVHCADSNLYSSLSCLHSGMARDHTALPLAA